jgi:hypothetical protein
VEKRGLEMGEVYRGANADADARSMQDRTNFMVLVG